jgi:hypothetical protein
LRKASRKCWNFRHKISRLILFNHYMQFHLFSLSTLIITKYFLLSTLMKLWKSRNDGEGCYGWFFHPITSSPHLRFYFLVGHELQSRRQFLNYIATDLTFSTGRF